MRRPGRGEARPPRAGADGGGRGDRRGGHRPGGGRALRSDPDVGQSVAPRADRRRPGGAGLHGAWWGALSAQPRPTRRAAGPARGRPGRGGLGRPVLDAAAHRRGGARAMRGGLHPGGARSAAAPTRLERAGPGPPGRRTQRGANHRPARGDLAGGKRMAADLGAWGVFEDESGQGLRPPKGRTWGRRGRTPGVRVTAANSPRLSLPALLATRRAHRPRLIYRTHTARRSSGRREGRRGGRRKGLTEADYAALLDAAHRQLGGPIVGVWDNLNTHVSAAMTELIAAGPWLTVYRLPP